jgi:organic radical activating enzyme
MDCEQRHETTRAALAYSLEHPRWRVSLQSHKLMGLP